MRSACAAVVGLALALSGGAAADEEGSLPPVQAEMEEADDQDATRTSEDPWEGMNRKIFAFNEGVDRWFLEPVATGWDWALPETVQRSIGNFFDHMQLPVRFANDVLQLKPRDAYETFWRAIINTTVGIGGLFDPASTWTVLKSDEDFGQTLGAWGAPPGPYLVLPLLGPSNPRDTVGLVVDRAAYVPSYFVPFYVSASAAGTNIVNARAGALEDIRAEREAAFDFYTAVRSAFLQYRENRVRDRADDPAEDAEDDDLYYFQEDEIDVRL
jgi:phospholipid-binding lipoprotein MlaA